VAGSVGRRAWGTFQEEVGRDLVAPGPPPLGGWPFAPWPLDTWCLGFSAWLALLRRVVVVWRPDSRSSPSWRPARQGRYTTALRRLMPFFPADRLRAVVVQGMGSLRAAAALRVVGGSGRLQARQRHQGSVPWSKKAPGLRASVTRPAPFLASGWVGVLRTDEPSEAARVKTETDIP
jgi:hypothetical protein